MTVGTLIYGIVPLFVDLTETHVFHPDWTPHSRMYMVWLLGTNSSVAEMALFFLWLHKKDLAFGIQLTGVLGLCVNGGFMQAHRNRLENVVRSSDIFFVAYRRICNS